MDYMLDTLNIDEIRKWSSILPLAGVTSNPSIAKLEGGVPFFDRIREVRSIIGDGASLHVQVIAQDCEGMIKDAMRIRQECGVETYIKVPVTKEGLSAIKKTQRRWLQGYSNSYLYSNPRLTGH